MERIPSLGVFLHANVRKRAVDDKRINEAGYYRVRAADLMAKAQTAPSKAIRIAYLNLARMWGRKAASLEKEWLETQTGAQPEASSSVEAGQKS